MCPLFQALALPDRGFVSLVGGGGKSTLLLRLALLPGVPVAAAALREPEPVKEVFFPC